MKRTPLRRKPRTPAQKKEQETRRTRDLEVYLRIWEKSDKHCWVTGKYLGKEPRTTFFHHLLAKAKYPEYRHCPWNIVLVSSEVHAQVETDPGRVPLLKEKTEYLLEQHRNGLLEKCTT